MKKYEQIFKLLKQDILNETYQIDDYLPSEHELVQTYKVSRDTIRKSLDLLQKAELIQKIRGQGSKVIKQAQIDFPVSNLTSYQELVQQHGINSKTNLIQLGKITVDKKLSNLTGFPEYRLVWRIVRQRVVDDVASVLDIDYLDKTLVPSLTREIAEQSIYAYLEEELRLRIAYAQKEITIDPATNRDQILMDIGTDQHVVSVKSKVYLADGQQFQFTDSRHKLEKFRFIDFAKRQKR
ncbi:Trehalose operon transcriptional repressor [Streptococcus intermedius]|uniref:trehalose operon repressor n=1 Tax=Streptococcus intermedius TaxID=1338 RepID=UPI000F67BAB1|nr:trehalose operon repressor [Streptococcus intermedius]RSJ10510.1 Trehalose operon transcriptional repressor [Streptococcus intermedius]RSJ16442.1 Trehalose operon transcriptional repressor [Streptococcus intermedius]RSJ31853.1 Trehalose operon transcriptional repressor [Streptococcus intermedius]